MLVLHQYIVICGAVSKEINNFSQRMNKMMILKTLKIPWDFSPRKKIVKKIPWEKFNFEIKLRKLPGRCTLMN